LLQPQGSEKNLCAQVIPAQPLNCFAGQIGGVARLEQPQFETDQTRLTMVRVAPGQSVTLGEADRLGLLIALDSGVAPVSGDVAGKTLPAGGFVWLERGKPAEKFKNDGATEVRLVFFALKR
jgi:hypothetical protein